MDDHLGQNFGSYRLIRLIGSGGFASVYEGEHILLGSKVAVKILGRLEQHETGRFLQEAKIIADLRHPNIIRLLDFAIQDGQPFLVMDYASNGTLADQHPKGSILTAFQVVSYVKQIADALQYAHDRSLIHRDVKPSNMLVQENGEIVLSDFGIARANSESATTATGGIAGTPVFMAPEQALGRPRPASDQYSLAICAYLWLCGTYPFQGNSPYEIILQHLEVPPLPLREHNSAISLQVEQVLLMALAKKPEDRFSTIAEFAQYLEDASLGRELIIPSLTQKLSSLKPPSSYSQTMPSMIASYQGLLPPVDQTVVSSRDEQTAYVTPSSSSIPSTKSRASISALLLRLLTYLVVMPLSILLTPLLLLYYYCARSLRKTSGPILEARPRPGLIANFLSQLPLPKGFWPVRLIIGIPAATSTQTPWNFDPYSSLSVDIPPPPPPILVPIQGERHNEQRIASQSNAWWRRLSYAVVKGPLFLRVQVQNTPPPHQYQPPYHYNSYSQQQVHTPAPSYSSSTILFDWQGSLSMGPADSGANGGTTTGGRKNFCVLYHDNDRNWAEWIAWLLEEDGLSSIVPEWDFRAGYNSERETRKAISEAQRVIVIISPDYLDARNTQWGIVFNREIMSQEGMILPVIVKECRALRKPLDSLVPINLVGRDVFFTSHKLRKAVRLMRSKPKKRPAFPPTAHLEQEMEVNTTAGQQSRNKSDPDHDLQQDITTGASKDTAFIDTDDPMVAKTIRFSEANKEATISLSQIATLIESAFNQKDWPDVIRKSKFLAQQLQPTDIPWEIYRMQALAYHAQGQMELARTALENALTLMNNREDRLALLDEYANSLALLKRWQEMLIYTEEALTIAPNDIRWQALREQITKQMNQEKPLEPNIQQPTNIGHDRTIREGDQKKITSMHLDELSKLPNDQKVGEMITMVTSSNPISIFVAYAPNDAELCANLKNQLTTLIYQHQLQIWYDHDISPGKERMKIMEERLNASHMIILLVSAYFLGSEYHYRQMQIALEMHRSGSKRVIPILLRPSDWEKTPLGELQALPRDNKPVTTWRNTDEALVNIVKGIRLAVEELQALPQ